MPVSRGQDSQDNPKIDNKLFIILHIYYILMVIDYVLDIPRVVRARIDISHDYALRADIP